MVFTLNGTVNLTFDLWTSESRGVIYWPWPIFLPSTMTVTHKFFKILSGHDVSNGRTDRQTDECHTIIRPKFLFGRIKIKVFRSCQSIWENLPSQLLPSWTAWSCRSRWRGQSAPSQCHRSWSPSLCHKHCSASTGTSNYSCIIREGHYAKGKL